MYVIDWPSVCVEFNSHFDLVCIEISISLCIKNENHFIYLTFRNEVKFLTKSIFYLDKYLNFKPEMKCFFYYCSKKKLRFDVYF